MKLSRRIGAIAATGALGLGMILGTPASPAQAATFHHSAAEVAQMKKALDTSTNACQVFTAFLATPLAAFACNGPADTKEWVNKAYYKGCGLDAVYHDGYTYERHYTYSLAC